MTTEDYYLCFQSCPGIGPKTFDTIMRCFDSDLERAWQSSESTWLKLGLTQRVVTAWFVYKETFSFDELKLVMERAEISYIHNQNQRFPSLLKQTATCPLGLFIKGQWLPQDNRAIAVVGTRKITPYGRDVTQRFVADLVVAGLTIISGLARGVDGIAHRTALDKGGRTIAVLGGGLDTIYPPEHRALAAEICQHGALISEYPPGILPVPGNFPARNRIVSGLSFGVLVTEGASKSGSKITAMDALDQNREVFAVPGPINNPMSSGPGELIQMGAKLVMSVQDILAELPDLTHPKLNGAASDQRIAMVHFEDQNQASIWSLISSGIYHIDDLVRETHLPAAQILTALTLMELSGHVKSLGNGQYMGV